MFTLEHFIKHKPLISGAQPSHTYQFFSCKLHIPPQLEKNFLPTQTLSICIIPNTENKTIFCRAMHVTLQK